MVQLETLTVDSSVDDILKVFQRDGACIIKDVLPADVVSQTLREGMPYVDRTKTGRKTLATAPGPESP